MLEEAKKPLPVMEYAPTLPPDVSAPPPSGTGINPVSPEVRYMAEIEQRISEMQPQIREYGQKYVDLALQNFELHRKYADDPETKQFFAEQLAMAKKLRPTPDQVDAALKERESADSFFKKSSGEYKEPPMYPKEDFLNFSSIALLLAALSGFATNDPFLTSLTSFTKAMEGYMTGRKEAADRNYEIFKGNFSRGLQQRNAAHEKVREILENEKMPLDVKLAESKYHLGMGEKQVKTIGDVYHRFTDNEKMLYSAENQFLKVQQQWEKKQHEKSIEGIVAHIAARDKLTPEQHLKLLSKAKAESTGVVAGATTGARISAYEKAGDKDYNDAVQIVRGTLAYSDIPAARGKRDRVRAAIQAIDPNYNIMEGNLEWIGKVAVVKNQNNAASLRLRAAEVALTMKGGTHDMLLAARKKLADRGFDAQGFFARPITSVEFGALKFSDDPDISRYLNLMLDAAEQKASVMNNGSAVTSDTKLKLAYDMYLMHPTYKGLESAVRADTDILKNKTAAYRQQQPTLFWKNQRGETVDTRTIIDVSFSTFPDGGKYRVYKFDTNPNQWIKGEKIR